MKRTCKGCNKDISHKHPNAKFHSLRCKDRYHNTHNPRGYGLQDDRFVAHDGKGTRYRADGSGEDEFGNPCFIGVSNFDNIEHDCNKDL